MAFLFFSFHAESDADSAAAAAAEAAAERERGLAESLARESERAKSLEQHLMQFEDVDASKQQEEERKRVLEVRMGRGCSLETVRMDRGGAPVRQSGVRSGRRERELAAGHVANRRVDAPASHRVDESVYDPGRRGLRSASQLDNTQKTELVLGGLPLELYESFVQVIVPILQSRERANLQVFKRQALVYGRSWTSVGRRDEAQRGRSAGAVVCAGERGEHAYGRGVDGDGDGDGDIDGDGGDGSSRECRAETEEEWEREKGMKCREKVDLERLNVFIMEVFVR